MPNREVELVLVLKGEPDVVLEPGLCGQRDANLDWIIFVLGPSQVGIRSENLRECRPRNRFGCLSHDAGV